MRDLQELINWLQSNIAFGPVFLGKILGSLLAILVLWILRQLILRSLIHRIENPRQRYQRQKTTGYLFFLAGLLVVGPIWFEGVSSIATYLGLVSAGLAIALKDPVTDMVGRFFIAWNRAFEVGDRIQIGGYAGDVIDQRIFQFTLMEIGNWVDAEQSTGRILHIPNGMVFTSALANYTKGSRYIWNEIPVLVTFESNWEKAKALLQEIVDRHEADLENSAEQSFQEAKKRYLIEYGKLTATVYTSVKDSGVMLTLRYLCEPRSRRDSTQTIWESILRAFAQHEDIDLAYPTRRVFNNLQEGKEGTRPSSVKIESRLNS